MTNMYFYMELKVCKFHADICSDNKTIPMGSVEKLRIVVELLLGYKHEIVL